jgi:hypothetical protein
MGQLKFFTEWPSYKLYMGPVAYLGNNVGCKGAAHWSLSIELAPIHYEPLEIWHVH